MFRFGMLHNTLNNVNLFKLLVYLTFRFFFRFIFINIKILKPYHIFANFPSTIPLVSYIKIHILQNNKYYMYYLIYVFYF